MVLGPHEANAVDGNVQRRADLPRDPQLLQRVRTAGGSHENTTYPGSGRLAHEQGGHVELRNELEQLLHAGPLCRQRNDEEAKRSGCSELAQCLDSVSRRFRVLADHAHTEVVVPADEIGIPLHDRLIALLRYPRDDPGFLQRILPHTVLSPSASHLSNLLVTAPFIRRPRPRPLPGKRPWVERPPRRHATAVCPAARATRSRHPRVHRAAPSRAAPEH